MANLGVTDESRRDEIKRGNFTPRSSKLKDMDRAIPRFDKAETDANLKKLKGHLDAAPSHI